MILEPVYERAGSWYFTLQEKEYGPCENEDDAWTYYEYIVNGGKCPTCEE